MQAINPHPRFPSLTANIRRRRGQRVRVSIPAYRDAHTPDALRRQVALLTQLF